MADTDNAAIVSLLDKHGLSPSSKITLTQAEELFDLEFYHLRHIDHEEKENPKNSSYAPIKLFSAVEVAEKALRVHGPTGNSPAVKQQRATAKRQREEAAERIKEEQKAKAARIEPKTPEENVCKKLGVTPSSSLTKKRAVQLFGLADWDLEDWGVKFSRKPNPVNPKFKPMKLFPAGEVAKAAMRHGRHY